MKRNDEGGMMLSPEERHALTFALAVHILTDPDALRWEDVGELSEGSFDQLADEMAWLAGTLKARCNQLGGDAVFETVR